MPTKTYTALYPKLKYRINAEYERLNKDTLKPWRLFNSVGLRVKKFNGTLINYGGIEFWGSPQDVFWNGYIEPFMEDSAIKTIAWTIKECESNNLHPNKPLEETAELLKFCFQKLYEEMAKIDRILLGRGSPDIMPFKKVGHKIDRMSQFIDVHTNSEKKLWESRNKGSTTKPESAQPKPESKSKKKRDSKFTRSDPGGKIQKAIRKLKGKNVPQHAVPYRPEILLAAKGEENFIDRNKDYKNQVGIALATVKAITRKIYNG